MTSQSTKLIKQLRVRKSLNPNKRLRLSVYKSNKHVFAQVIDDVKKKTIVTVSDLDEEFLKEKKLKKTERSRKVGELLAKKTLAMKIEEVVFDRGHFRYHGRIKALADGARSAGLKF